MANFAVSANDEVIARGKELLDKMAKPGEKQGAVLERIFALAEQHQDGEVMRQGGVDVQALDASIANIRTMFLSAVTGKEQIIAEKDEKIAEVKNLKDQMERDLRNKLNVANKEKDEAVARAESVAKAAAQAVKDSQAAKEQAETASSLAAERERTISTLADKLSAAEYKAERYDTLSQKEAEAREKIRELQEQIDRKISEAEKDIALAVANAVAAKEREMTAQLREADKENARLQARIELLEEQLHTAVDSRKK